MHRLNLVIVGFEIKIFSLFQGWTLTIFFTFSVFESQDIALFIFGDYYQMQYVMSFRLIYNSIWDSIMSAHTYYGESTIHHATYMISYSWDRLFMTRALRGWVWVDDYASQFPINPMPVLDHFFSISPWTNHSTYWNFFTPLDSPLDGQHFYVPHLRNTLLIKKLIFFTPVFEQFTCGLRKIWVNFWVHRDAIEHNRNLNCV